MTRTKSLLVGLVVLCAACSSDETASDAASASLCAAQDVLHEHEFAEDESLRATFDHVVVSHVETSDDTEPEEHDSSELGREVIPYESTRVETRTFTLAEDHHIASASLVHANDQVLFTIRPG